MAGKKLYNWGFPESMSPLAIEMDCIRRGGKWKRGDGEMAGEGIGVHFRKGIQLIWPFAEMNRWFDTFIDEFLSDNRTIAVLGPASSGKSFSAAICGLFDYFCFPSCTTGVYCSTTRELLQQRIWGEVVSLHQFALKRYSWLPGVHIESRLRIVTSYESEDGENERNFKNGLLGVPAKSGETYVGLSSFVGLKNKRLRFYGDELSLLPKAFIDAISNLDKNPDFKAVGMGNPKDTTDPLGILAEPSMELGGWDGGIDQDPVSKTWKTRRPKGVCIQFVGTDSPNLDGKLKAPLITQEAIDRDIAFYSKDSLQFTMMNQGMMPRGQGSRRVLTRTSIEKNNAKLPPMWLNSNRTKGASLDAAYRGVGGDRCVLKFWEFGEELTAPDGGEALISALVSQPNASQTKRHIFAVTETLIVPISNKIKDDPENQIALFCMNECIKRGVPPEHFFYDSGMRTALVEAFMRLWSLKTNSVDCGGTPSERPVSYDIDVPCNKFYRKFVSELWFSVRWTVLSGQFRGMTEGEIEELCSREWGIVGNNLTEVEPKSDMKKKTGRSPDEGDCLAVGIEGARQLGFVIRKLKPAKEPESDDRWKRDMKDKSRRFWTSGALSA